ncbi:MAG: hypothetical protein IIT96_06585, partial [Muribaculaceae bacterium]|nr:hypothetical protein [Muribaculaceae bacterium]
APLHPHKEDLLGVIDVLVEIYDVAVVVRNEIGQLGDELRALFGKLLAEVQRIKSEGDFEAGRKLVETYGVKVDPKIHAEILKRYENLNIAPYKGFVNPVYKPVYDANGEIKDITISYNENYVDQHLRYGRDYSPLTK